MLFSLGTFPFREPIRFFYNKFNIKHEHQLHQGGVKHIQAPCFYCYIKNHNSEYGGTFPEGQH